jgi:hypothetical protein
MALDRGRLANIDRRLLAELHDDEEWQPVRIRVSSATWSTWKRYCDVVGLSMGKAIVALIESELATVVDDDLDSALAVIAARQRQLDEREAALDRRAKDLDKRDERWGRRPTRREIERMADEIEPPDPGWTPPPATVPTLDVAMFKGVGRNEGCPCGSGRKFKNCHWDEYRRG